MPSQAPYNQRDRPGLCRLIRCPCQRFPTRLRCRASSRELLAGPGNPLLQYEVDDPELLEIPVVTVDHLLAWRDLQRRTVAQVEETLASEVPTRGVFLRGVTRAGQDLPLRWGLVLQQGDTLRLVGARRHAERVAANLRYNSGFSVAFYLQRPERETPPQRSEVR
jgi:hypothetical protein